MNLVVDYGNTNAKVGIFDQRTLVEKHTFASHELLKEYLKKTEAQNIIISSVNISAEIMAGWVGDRINTLILTSQLPLPLKNLYATPLTLGVDRLAGACGAYSLFPGTNALIIDAGSCITFDFVDAGGNYLGGSIAPGMMMRFEAVHTFTANLPLVKPAENPALIGNSTDTCIQSGIINGIVAEMDGLIDRYGSKYSNLRVILCGGDAGFFENRLKGPIFASPDLVLIGLNSILIYNVNL